MAVATPAPPLTPVTRPAASIVAMDVGLIVHVPDGVVLASSVVWPTHVVREPVIGLGSGFTDIVRVL